MARLALLHQAPGAVEPPPGSALWRTCLRDVIFLAAEAQTRPSAIYDGAAYALLVEIVSGLRSPLIGETEVQAQFKAFLATLDTETHGDLLRLGQRVLTDARLIRRRHLQGFGVRSYSGLVGGHVPAGAHVVLIGTGALAADIASDLGTRHGIDQWGRRTPARALSSKAPVCFRLFSAAAPDVLHTADSAVLVVAAPASSSDLDRIATGYPGLVRIVDLRPADERCPLAVTVPIVTLDDLFAEANADARVASRPVAAARVEIAALGRAYANRDELRPFGWDDLCA
jgi:glutamyl-tRNA reductase